MNQKQKILVRIYVVEERFFGAIEVHAPHSDRDHVGAAGFEGARIFLEGAVLAGAYDQPGAELSACDG